MRAGGAGGRGLPIGNLTSQWLANLLLDRLDRFVTGELEVRGYVRYMDDFVLFADEKAVLRGAHAEIARLLTERFDLGLKERATLLAPTRCGLPFLGWRIYRGTTRLRPENLRRTRARLRRRAWQRREGRITDEAYRAAVRSVFEHLRHGSTLGLRRGLCTELDARAPPGARGRLGPGGGPPAPPTA